MVSMNKRRLAARISRDDPQVRVTGFRREGRSTGVECVDTRNGIPFVVPMAVFKIAVSTLAEEDDGE